MLKNNPTDLPVVLRLSDLGCYIWSFLSVSLSRLWFNLLKLSFLLSCFFAISSGFEVGKAAKAMQHENQYGKMVKRAFGRIRPDRADT